MGAMLNVIPYIGGITAVTLPAIIAFATKPPSYVLLVVALYIIIQFIDNHYISPKVVASKVKINALVSLITVLLGAAVWGVPGMFLSIPFVAVLKIIFEEFLPILSAGQATAFARQSLYRLSPSMKYGLLRKLLPVANGL